MKLILTIIFIVLLQSCSNNITKNCIEKEHVKIVFDQLNKMDCGFAKAESFQNELLFTNLFLQDITGIESVAYFGDIIFYEKKEDYITDINNWKSWFNKNSCLIDSMKVYNIQDELEEFKQLYSPLKKENK